MTEPVPAVAPLLRLLDGLDVAVFACDAAGVVGAANAAARSVLPGLATGEPAARVRVPELTDALAVGLDAFECECQGRVLVGMRTTGADGWMVWQVRDVTADRAREDALVAERTRNAFLIWASRRLGGSLNPARTERAIVDLAVELGDAATLVLPHGRGGYRWRHVTRGSAEHHGQCARSAALGVTTWSADALDAVRLIERGEPAEPGPDRRVRGADAEFTGLRTRRAELVTETMARLGERFPPMRAYDERRRDATVEDLGHIVDFLAAALYIDDVTLFADFLVWTAEVLTARDVPRRSLDLTLTVLTETLADYPRKQAMLASVNLSG